MTEIDNLIADLRASLAAASAERNALKQAITGRIAEEFDIEALPPAVYLEMVKGLHDAAERLADYSDRDMSNGPTPNLAPTEGATMTSHDEALRRARTIIEMEPSELRQAFWWEQSARLMAAALAAPAPDSRPASVDGSPLLEWAVSKWNAEVKNRPLVNVHRRSLDDCWRQVIRWAGGDPAVLVGPSHDEMLAAIRAERATDAEAE